MPEWVTNGLYLEGDAAEIASIKSRLNRPFERREKDYVNSTNPISRNRVRKYPNPVFAFWNISNPLEEYLDSATNKLVKADISREFDPDWYLKEWGTTSDVAVWDGQEYPTTLLNISSENRLAYQFDTAWSPCPQVICTLSIQNPSLKIVYDYELPTGEGSSIELQGKDFRLLESYNWKCPECDFAEKGVPKETCRNCGFESEFF